MYKCPGCGAALRFDPKTQSMLCTHCGQSMSAKDERLKHANESQGQDAYGVSYDAAGRFQSIVYTCPNCGGQILSTEETAATFCSYCGSSVTLSGRLEKMEAPDVIIPFKLDKNDCKAAYKKLLKKAIFAPSYMKSEAEIDKFRGIYMPYWIYSYYADGTASGNAEKSHRSGNYIITDHYRLSRDIQGGFEGISYDAASNFSDVMSQSIAPFNAAEAEEFRDAYMSGFYADVSDVPKELYEAEAEDVTRRYMAEQTVKDSTFISYGVTANQVKDSFPVIPGERFKGYFPVWFLANRVRSRKEVSYAVVNGETGKIAADLPIAFWKYILASLLLSVPIFLLLNLLLTLTPSVALIVTTVITVITFFVLNHQLNRTYTTANQLNDKGLQHQKEAEQTKDGNASQTGAKPKKSKWKTVLITIAAILGIGLFFLYTHGFDDEEMDGFFFIMGVVAVVGLIVFTVIKSIIENNRTGVTYKAPAKKKGAYLWKPIVAAVVSVFILIIAPASDVWYYGAAILSEVFIAWCAFDTVALHNKETLRPLPQFNKRGGTGNE